MPSNQEIREAALQYVYAEISNKEEYLSDRLNETIELICEPRRLSYATSIKRITDSLVNNTLRQSDRFFSTCLDFQTHLKTKPKTDAVRDQLVILSRAAKNWINALINLRKINISDVENHNLVKNLEDSLDLVRTCNASLALCYRDFHNLCSGDIELDVTNRNFINLIKKNQKVSSRINEIFEFETEDPGDDLRKIYQLKLELESFKKGLLKSLSPYFSLKDATNTKISAIIENFNMSRVHRLDLAVITFYASEMLSSQSGRSPAIINEAVEMAKKFGSSDSGRFINGVLDQLAKERS